MRRGRLTTTLTRRNGDPAPDGAALTYARRYALFTLVGIAGEDDFDAPDLNLKAGASAKEGDSNQGEAAQATIPRADRAPGPQEREDATFQPALGGPSERRGACQSGQRPQGPRAASRTSRPER
jgi:hypothetical protein